MFWFSQGRKIMRAKAGAGTFKKQYIMRVLVPVRSWHRNRARLRVGIWVKKLQMVHMRVRLLLRLLYRSNYCTQVCVMLQVIKQDGGGWGCGYCKNHPFYHKILWFKLEKCEKKITRRKILIKKVRDRGSCAVWKLHMGETEGAESGAVWNVGPHIWVWLWQWTNM